jgi:hypothetical protein
MRWLCCLLALLLWPFPSSAVSLNFNLLPNGSSPTQNRPVGATFAVYGVTFATLDATGPPVFNRSGNIPPDWNVTDGARVLGSPYGFHIIALFSTPVRSVSADFSTGVGYSVKMTAVDVNNMVLGVAEAALPIRRLSLQDIGEIKAVAWESSDPFVAGVSIDNLEFTPIPEPAAGALLGLGLGALALRARSARARSRAL